MSWIQNIALKAIAKKSKKTARKVRVHNLHTAKNIGIVYNATSRTNDEKVLKLERFFKEERKKVTVLGFVDTKKAEEMPEQRMSRVFFNKKDLNILGLPKSKQTEVQAFVQQPFDVLISLDIPGNTLPLLDVFARSKAQFKISPADELWQPYADFMIDISTKPELSYFIIQLKHYLKLINKKTEEYEHA